MFPMNRWIAILVWLAGSAVTHAASRVVAVHSESSPADVRAMVVAGVKNLTGAADEAAAWGALVSSNDVVGIKINTQAAPLLATHRSVVDAIVAGLRSAGVAPDHIWIWDRDLQKMRAAGYALPGTEREVAVTDGTGWDAEAFYENKLVGRLIWGDLLFRADDEQLSTRSHLPKILTRTITRLINVPVLQSHDACGVCGCLYNLSMATVDNARRFEQYNQNGDPAIAEICALPAIRRKLALNVMDALVAGYAGGPVFRPQYSWQPNTLYFSADPVAVDAVCLQRLEAKRKAARIPPFGDKANHIATAARLGLGKNDLKQIESVEVTPGK